MRLWNIQQRTPEWDMARAGKYTGKKVKGIMGRTREEWENHLVAERLSMTGIEETDLQRGNRLEPEAIAHFEKHFKKKVSHIGLTTRDDNIHIASSPDGLIFNDEKGKFTEAVEVKCLAGKKHIQAFFDKLAIRDEALAKGENPSYWEVVPDDYKPQSLQYFIVNEALETLYFCFYSEVIGEIPMIVIRLSREELAAEIARQYEVEIKSLETVQEKTEKILFFSEEEREFIYE